MRKNVLLLISAAVVIVGVVSGAFYPAASNDTGAPIGNTGSPADNHTCARSGCHPGTATFIADLITSDVPLTGYVPGTTYTITASVSDPAINKFGFQISPQSVSGTQLGTLSITDVTNTKFAVPGTKYVTHTLTGTTATNHTCTWSFGWTAPAVGTGDVTFYGAFNFSNSNGQTTGDVIHTSTLTVPEAVTAGVGEPASVAALNVYPNPVTDYVRIGYYLQQSQSVRISLFDLSGKEVALLMNQEQQSGVNSQSFSINNSISAGIYILRLETGGQYYTRKIVKA